MESGWSSTLPMLLTPFVFALTGWWCSAWAVPVPGDVFREYLWWNEKGDAGGAFRVGERGMDAGHATAPVVLDHDFDLENATKAEIVIEKILCHDSTRGLAVQVNDGDWLDVPEAAKIPAPQWEYQHHFCPVVSVPLAMLKPGRGNQFRMRVGPEHSWNWPQNLIYGVHFRVYYDAAKKPHPTGRITGLEAGATIGRSVELRCEAHSPNGAIKQVDYLCNYEDVNWEGDGEYRQWHYHFLHGKLMHHLGTATEPPLAVTWDTSWVPDQDEPLALAARVTDSTGLTYWTDSTEARLVRPGLSVELCKPYEVPTKWVTRSGEKHEKFAVKGDLTKAVAAQLCWSSWSPGYMNGVYVNDQRVFDNEGPRYAYFAHRVTLNDLSAFRRGENVLKTGTTPKHNGQMVHGMEVNWPGIMVLVRYETDQ
jgi:hypothetical protein